MLRRVWIGVASAILAAGLIATPAAAAGTTRWVNDDDPNGGAYSPPGTSCTNPGYPTIQSAVNAASAGDTILVCPGTYQEQVTISGPAKNNLTLRSTSPLQAVIKAPALLMADPGDIVRVNGSRNVTIREFKIAGPLPDTAFCSTFPRTGVRVDGGGSALIYRNWITEIRSASPALRGCQNGVGILVGRQSEGQTGSALILENKIDLYQKNGMTIDNAGSTAFVVANAVRGIGPTPVIAQNGIQFSRGASGEARFNLVTDNQYSLFPLSTGFIIFQGGAVKLIGNVSERNDSGMYVEATPNIKVESNRVQKNVESGIYLFDVSDASIRENRVERNGNTFPENLGYTGGGIIISASSDNTVAYNKVLNNGRASAADDTDGIFADADSAGNLITRNGIFGNQNHDCHDDSVGPGNPPALVANKWVKNSAATENRPGLCPRAHDDDDDDDDHDHHGDDYRPHSLMP
jgi:parallel beta-helix repeat protein